MRVTNSEELMYRGPKAGSGLRYQGSFDCFASLVGAASDLRHDEEWDGGHTLPEGCSPDRVVFEWDMAHRLEDVDDDTTWEDTVYPMLREVKSALDLGIGNGGATDPMRTGVVAFRKGDNSYMAHARVAPVRHVVERDGLDAVDTYHYGRSIGLSVLEAWTLSDLYPVLAQHVKNGIDSYYDCHGNEHSNSHGRRLPCHPDDRAPCRDTGARNILLANRRTRGLLVGGSCFDTYSHDCKHPALLRAMCGQWDSIISSATVAPYMAQARYGGYKLSAAGAVDLAKLVASARQAALDVALDYVANGNSLRPVVPATTYNLAA